jgi:hypothetical protein
MDFGPLQYNVSWRKKYFKTLFNFKAYVTSPSRGIVHMKSFPSSHILNGPLKSNAIDRILNDVKLNLATYTTILCNSIIKDKQILTTNGKQMLLLPEHKLLYENLKRKYPEMNLNSKYFIIRYYILIEY